MTKAELISSLAEETHSTKAESERFIDAFLSVMSKALANEEEVRLMGFGTFKVRMRPASVGRNPRTGEPLDIPASKSPVFVAGKNLKDCVKGVSTKE